MSHTTSDRHSPDLLALPSLQSFESGSVSLATHSYDVRRATVGEEHVRINEAARSDAPRPVGCWRRS